MGSLPWEQCDFATGCSFYQTGPEWVPSMGFSPLGIGCFSAGTPCSHTSWPQTCSSMDSLLHQCTGPARHPIQHRLPTDHSCLCEADPSLAAGKSLLPCGLWWTSLWSSPWTAQNLSSWSTSSSYFSTNPTSAWLILSYILTPFLAALFQEFGFFPLSWIHYPGGATPIADGCVLDQGLVPLRPSWHWLSWTWGEAPDSFS